MSFEGEILRRFGDVSKVSSGTGVFVGMVGLLAQVNYQGSTVTIRCDGWNPPIVGMPVRVESVDGVLRVAGPARTLPARGEVLESLAGDTKARVVAGGIEYVLPVMAPYIPIPTDVVIINWGSEGHVLGEEASSPDVPDAPPTGGGGGGPFTNLLIYPTGSGKFDTAWGNWWGGAEVWASNNNKGIWVYGGRFAALAGAQIGTAEIYLPLITQAGSCSIGVHGYPGIPGGNPTITDTVPLNPRGGWVPIPWGNHLRDNPDAGIGVTSGAGLNKWRGHGQDALSGVIRFSGTR